MNVISKEVALEEVKAFLSDFIEVDFEVEKDYPRVLKAVIEGRLSFEENIPVYKLIEPVNVGTEFEKKEITFKTRVLPSANINLAKGIDLQKDSLKYGMVVTSHIIGLASFTELDKFSKKDYQLIQELAPVFM